MKGKSVTVKIPDPLFVELDRRAREEYSNKGAIIRQSLAVFLSIEEGKRRLYKVGMK